MLILNPNFSLYLALSMPTTSLRIKSVLPQPGGPTKCMASPASYICGTIFCRSNIRISASCDYWLDCRAASANKLQLLELFVVLFEHLAQAPDDLVDSFVVRLKFRFGELTQLARLL